MSSLSSVKKRPRETPPTLSSGSSCAEAVAWLSAVLPPFEGRDAALAAFSGVDGAALASMKESEMKRYGLKKWGLRRKLALLIDASAARSEGSSAAPAEAHDSEAPSAGETSEGSAPPPTSVSAPPPTSVSGPLPPPPTSVLDPPPPSSLDRAAIEAQLDAEASCLGICRWSVDAMKKATEDPSLAAWGSLPLRRGRAAALAELRSDLEMPGASVVVVGNTGAGKSTLLNALLEEREVLPTNGMRACTAVLVELSYLEGGGSDKKYEGAVEFVGKAEWEAEVEDLMGDLTTQEGRAVLHVNPGAHNYESWCKLYAVYGETFTHSSLATGQVVNGRRVYKPMMSEDLQKKLLRDHTVTHKLGTQEKVVSYDARDFRRKLEQYMDSANEVSQGQFWPIVKRVKARGKWDILKSGTVFVDAPGVNDDNSSRDKVVKSYLQSADSIWIVSNINRAVNDKTAKDMLDHNFRRQLLMDGSYGSLVFVATQSDVLQRSEVVRSMRLSQDASLSHCAQVRCRYTRRTVESHYIDGLEDMARAAGDVPDRAALESRFRLPVFCVSAIEYQKLAGLRPGDGPAHVWKDPKDTQIPALRAHVEKATLARRAEVVRRRTESLITFGAALVALCDEKSGEVPPKTRDALDAAMERVLEPLAEKMQRMLQDFDAETVRQFDKKVKPRLISGTADAAKGCLSTARTWSRPWTRSGGEGGLHWATYKACCRRSGAWRINMNEQLSSPILTSVSGAWEAVFVQDVGHNLRKLLRDIRAQVAVFHDALAPALLAAGLPDDGRVATVRQLLEAAGSTRAAAASERAGDAVRRHQKELSRSVAPTVQARMSPGYERGTAEGGTGSHARRVCIVEDHVSASSATMFDEAVAPILEAAAPLFRELRRTVAEVCADRTVEDLRDNYGMLWEATGPNARAARSRLRPRIQEAVEQGRTALQRLLRSQGKTDQDAAVASREVGREEGAEEDDGSVVDETDLRQAEAWEARTKDVIDLVDTDDDDNTNVEPCRDNISGPNRIQCVPEVVGSAMGMGLD